MIYPLMPSYRYHQPSILSEYYEPLIGKVRERFDSFMQEGLSWEINSQERNGSLNGFCQKLTAALNKAKVPSNIFLLQDSFINTSGNNRIAVQINCSDIPLALQAFLEGLADFLGVSSKQELCAVGYWQEDAGYTQFTFPVRHAQAWKKFHVILCRREDSSFYDADALSIDCKTGSLCSMNAQLKLWQVKKAFDEKQSSASSETISQYPLSFLEYIRHQVAGYSENPVFFDFVKLALCSGENHKILRDDFLGTLENFLDTYYGGQPEQKKHFLAILRTHTPFLEKYIPNLQFPFEEPVAVKINAQVVEPLSKAIKQEKIPLKELTTGEDIVRSGYPIKQRVERLLELSEQGDLTALWQSVFTGHVFLISANLSKLQQIHQWMNEQIALCGNFSTQGKQTALQEAVQKAVVKKILQKKGINKKHSKSHAGRLAYVLNIVQKADFAEIFALLFPKIAQPLNSSTTEGILYKLYQERRYKVEVVMFFKQKNPEIEKILRRFLEFIPQDALDDSLRNLAIEKNIFLNPHKSLSLQEARTLVSQMEQKISLDFLPSVLACLAKEKMLDAYPQYEKLLKLKSTEVSDKVCARITCDLDRKKLQIADCIKPLLSDATICAHVVAYLQTKLLERPKEYWNLFLSLRGAMKKEQQMNLLSAVPLNSVDIEEIAVICAKIGDFARLNTLLGHDSIKNKAVFFAKVRNRLSEPLSYADFLQNHTQTACDPSAQEEQRNVLCLLALEAKFLNPTFFEENQRVLFSAARSCRFVGCENLLEKIAPTEWPVDELTAFLTSIMAEINPTAIRYQLAYQVAVRTQANEAVFLDIYKKVYCLKKTAVRRSLLRHCFYILQQKKKLGMLDPALIASFAEFCDEITMLVQKRQAKGKSAYLELLWLIHMLGEMRQNVTSRSVESYCLLVEKWLQNTSVILSEQEITKYCFRYTAFLRGLLNQPEISADRKISYMACALEHMNQLLDRVVESGSTGAKEKCLRVCHTAFWQQYQMLNLDPLHPANKVVKLQFARVLETGLQTCLAAGLDLSWCLVGGQELYLEQIESLLSTMAHETQPSLLQCYLAYFLAQKLKAPAEAFARLCSHVEKLTPSLPKLGLLQKCCQHCTYDIPFTSVHEELQALKARSDAQHSFHQEIVFLIDILTRSTVEEFSTQAQELLALDGYYVDQDQLYEFSLGMTALLAQGFKKYTLSEYETIELVAKGIYRIRLLAEHCALYGRWKDSDIENMNQTLKTCYQRLYEPFKTLSLKQCLGQPIFENSQQALQEFTNILDFTADLYKNTVIETTDSAWYFEAAEQIHHKVVDRASVVVMNTGSQIMEVFDRNRRAILSEYWEPIALPICQVLARRGYQNTNTEELIWQGMVDLGSQKISIRIALLSYLMELYQEDKKKYCRSVLFISELAVDLLDWKGVSSQELEKAMLVALQTAEAALEEFQTTKDFSYIHASVGTFLVSLRVANQLKYRAAIYMKHPFECRIARYTELGYLLERIAESRLQVKSQAEIGQLFYYVPITSLVMLAKLGSSRAEDREVVWLKAASLFEHLLHLAVQSNLGFHFSKEGLSLYPKKGIMQQPVKIEELGTKFMNFENIRGVNYAGFTKLLLQAYRKNPFVAGKEILEKIIQSLCQLNGSEQLIEEIKKSIK